MIASEQPVSEAAIADHYDELDPFYRDIWGQHVHHGLWLNGNETSEEAVRKLVELVAQKAELRRDERVIDIGCGYGALAAFLAVRHPKSKIDYLGVDLSRPMIERARRRHSGSGRRFTTRTTGFRIADYSVASGIMNVSLGHSRATWEGFVARTLSQMRRTSRLGFSVNFFADTMGPGTPADRSVDDLYRTGPERWIRHCEDELDCAVETVADYGMKEFTLLARCNRIATA